MIIFERFLWLSFGDKMLIFWFRAQIEDRKKAEGQKEGLSAARALGSKKHPGCHRFDGGHNAASNGDARAAAIGRRDGDAELGGERQGSLQEWWKSRVREGNQSEDDVKKV